MKTVLNGLVNSAITKIDNGFLRPQKEMTTTNWAVSQKRPNTHGAINIGKRSCRRLSKPDVRWQYDNQ